MRLIIRNIGVIRDACIEIDGITVITGENLSGKSTALKALSSLISANNRTGGGLLSDAKLVALRSFRERFGDVINCPYIESEGAVSVTCDSGRKSEVVFARNEVKSFEPFDNESGKLSAVFLEAPSRFGTAFPETGKIAPSLMELLMKDASSDEIPEDCRKVVDSFIDDVIHGSFVRDGENGELMFRDDRMSASSLSMCNTPSGAGVFAVLRRLVQNRSLSENDILVIDEPETGLHPEWQIKLARLLVLIAEKMDVRIFLTTNSLYFLRAVEVVSTETTPENRLDCYLMRKENDGPLYRACCVTGKTEEIYREMYRPLEEL
jgi:predicted ATPase